LALSVASDPERLEQLQILEQQYQSFISGDIVDKLKLASDLAEAEGIEIRQTLDFWLTNMEKSLTQKADAPMASKKFKR